MREWASGNGPVVRQRSYWQEKTIARTGTFPENTQFEELTPTSLNQDTNTYEKAVEEGEDDVEESEDKIPQYESF